jgi:hypothetical protein
LKRVLRADWSEHRLPHPLQLCRGLIEARMARSKREESQSLIASAAMPRIRAWVAPGCNFNQPVEVMGPPFRMAGALLGIGKASVGEA